MSPKIADPAVRIALIEQAARIIAEEGHEALTLRRLAAAIGASTMAVYTHFGGMDDLRRAVRREGFARLATHLDTVEDTKDSVADLIVSGWAYYVNGTTNPNLYRAMFMDIPIDAEDAEVGLYTFQRLVDGVERCLEAGRFDRADPVGLARQLWVMQHGAVTLQIVGMLDKTQAVDCMATMGGNLLRGFGDSPRALARSVSRATPRFAEVGTPG